MNKNPTDKPNDKPAGVRSFVAVPLPGEIQSRILAAAQAMAPDLPDVRWSRKVENLHVTIKFLGQVDEERIGDLGVALDGALGTLPRFAVDARGMGAFPSERAANVIWVGLDDARRGLAAVAAAVEDVAERFGVARERRPFQAHVTVGRCKGRGVDARAALHAFTNHGFGSVDVTEVHLYESRLGGEGSTYVLRSRAGLGQFAN
jgi:2'-5' RNA ligase